ncbi:MAG: hypothetical protein ACXVB1_13850 [Pseudobdellovibrionaceae bacterium]
MRKILFFVIACLLVASCSQKKSSDQTENNSPEKPDTIPLLVTNEKGEAIVSEVSSAEYKQKVGSAGVTIYDSVLPVLEEQNSKSTKWALRTAAIGIGVSAEWGIGDWKLAVIPRIRFIFTNHKNPMLP